MRCMPEAQGVAAVGLLIGVYNAVDFRASSRSVYGRLVDSGRDHPVSHRFQAFSGLPRRRPSGGTANVVLARLQCFMALRAVRQLLAMPALPPRASHIGTGPAVDLEAPQLRERSFAACKTAQYTSATAGSSCGVVRCTRLAGGSRPGSTVRKVASVLGAG